MNTNKILATLLLTLLVTGVCFCAEDLKKPLQQCVKIHTSDRDGGGSRGTGTYVATRLVATCAHNVRNRLSDDSVEVEFPSSEMLAGKVVYFDETCDVAIIELDRTPRCKPLYMSEELTDGEPLAIQGYARGYRQVWGTLSVDKHGPAGQWRTVAGASAVQGESGGPVLNKIGAFVGVLWGSDGSQTYFTPAAEVIKRLGEHAPPSGPSPPPVDPPNLYGDRT